MGEEDQVIGIMGGTFDPIHNGHLVTAECASYQYDLDKVVFVPSGHPPHKTEKRITNAEDRYSMALLATMSNPRFRVSRIEIDRKGLSYTIDTVREFKKIYPQAKIYFITGADAILEIFTWKAPNVLLEEVEFIAASRPGYCLSQLGQEIYDEYRDSINLLEIPGLAISSTDIRTRIRQGRPIKYQLPEEVEAYIKKHGLYIQREE